MKKNIVILTLTICFLFSFSIYNTYAENNLVMTTDNNEESENDQVEYYTEVKNVCSTSSVKTYMDYRSINAKNSKQYKYIQAYLTVNETTGLLEDDEGFIAVALGSSFGDIGSKFIFTLDTGIQLKVVKVDQKSDNDTINGCYQAVDKSVIEFVLDSTIAKSYYPTGKNNLVSSGNLNTLDDFNGHIEKIEKVLGYKQEIVDKEYDDSYLDPVEPVYAFTFDI